MERIKLIDALASTTIVMSFLATVFGYVVIKPLNTSINELKQTIRELREEFRREKEKSDDVRESLIRVEQIAKSAQKRCDSFEIELRNIKDKKCH